MRHRVQLPVDLACLFIENEKSDVIESSNCLTKKELHAESELVQQIDNCERISTLCYGTWSHNFGDCLLYLLTTMFYLLGKQQIEVVIVIVNALVQSCYEHTNSPFWSP